MGGTLLRAMNEFLERRLQGKDLNVSEFDTAFRGSGRADFLLHEGRVVVEVKNLETQRGPLAQRCTDKWRREPDWPIFTGELTIPELVALHPRGIEFQRDLVAAITRPVQGDFEHANRQIRATKKALGLGEPLGLLVVLNEGVDILDPEVLAGRLAQLLKRPAHGGSRRFESIDSVIVVSWAHSIAGESGVAAHPVFRMSAEEFSSEEEERSFENSFIQEWAAFIQRPLTDGGQLESPEALSALTVLSPVGHTVLEGDRIRLWPPG